MDQRKSNVVQVSRSQRYRVLGFLILSIFSLCVTIYQIKSNNSVVIPVYQKEISMQEKTLPRTLQNIEDISNISLQRLSENNVEDVSNIEQFGLELIDRCLNDVAKKSSNYNYELKGDCFDQREKAVRTTKRHLAKTASSIGYSRYKKRKGKTSVPLKIYRLAPKIFNKVPDNFLDQYKNPCWKHKGNDLYCLPYFYIIGMPKCGSSDLYDKVTSHPQIVRPKWKEPGFWTKLQYTRHPHDLSIYMEYFTSFREALSQTTENSTIITADGTVASMWSLFDVQFLNDGVGFGLPNVLRAIQPNAKFFIILRDPVERLLSDYHYFGDFKRTPEDFHHKVLIAIQEYNKCMKRNKNELACIGIERTWTADCITRVSLGIYSVLLRQWFQVFPTRQFFVISLTQWESNCVEVLASAYQFLSLDPVSDDHLKNICSKRRVLGGSRHKVAMNNDTREILECFYAPYQQDLKRLLSSRLLREWDL